MKGFIVSIKFILVIVVVMVLENKISSVNIDNVKLIRKLFKWCVRMRV